MSIGLEKKWLVGLAAVLLSGCLAHMPEHLGMIGSQIASDLYARGAFSGDRCRQQEQALYQMGMSPAAAQAELTRLGCMGSYPATAGPTVMSSARPVVQSDPFIADIQKRLNDAGYDAGPVDGVLGPRTTTAITEYQKAQGLPEDGAPSPALLIELERTVAQGD